MKIVDLYENENLAIREYEYLCLFDSKLRLCNRYQCIEEWHLDPK